MIVVTLTAEAIEAITWFSDTACSELLPLLEPCRIPEAEPRENRGQNLT